MTAQEYTAVAEACDRLLQAPGTSLERLAVPLLHVIKEHPSWLRQYQPPAPAGAAGGAKLPWRRLAAAGRSAISALLRSAWQTAAAMARRDCRAPVQVLIVSHLTSPAQLNGDGDAYFGSLQELLQARGVSSRLLLIDHLRDEAARTACRARLQQPPRQLLPRAVGVAAELQIWWRCLRARRRLRQEARESPDPLVRGLALLAAREVVRGQTLANLRLHATVARICMRLRPQIVITTHEGDACERVVWHAARGRPNPPLCVGYQHALLLQHAHAIRRCIGGARAAVDPDVILTSGQISHAALAGSPRLRAVHLIAYGSHRHDAVRGRPPWLARPRQCLVVPDADESECIILFGFAIACAQRCPDLAFVLRPHPVVDVSLLVRGQPNLQVPPRNVWISTANLTQDCLQARYCLYRGSSAALHAVRCGVKPFYLQRTDEMRFDPLFTLGPWRETVTTPEDFARRAARAEAAPDLTAAQHAWDESDRYMGAVRPAALDELLALAGSGHRGQALAGDFLNRIT